MSRTGLFVHHLVPPEQLLQATEQLGELLFDLHPGAPDRVLLASPTSGCLSFADASLLRTGAGRGPATAAEGEAAAERFLRDGNRRVRGAAIPGLTQTGLFPDDARLVVSTPVYAGTDTGPDHWLCSYAGVLGTGQLPENPQAPPLPSAPVLGAQIDVRIGPGGTIAGLWSDWRPVRASELCDALPPPADTASQLVYQGGGHDDPLELLAPFHLQAGEGSDTGTLWPASTRSLSVRLDRVDDDDGTRLSAEVSGGSGRPRFAWGAWRLDQVPGEFAALGGSPTLQLAPGAYNVVLDVQDELSGAFTRCQYVVCCGPSAAAAVT